MGFGIVIPILPLYGERFGPSGLTLGLLMASYSAMQFVFAPILGRLSDRVGRRPVLLVSLVGSVIGYLLFGFAGSMAVLFASRIIDGISGGNIATAQAVIADITGPEDRAKGMGIIGAAFGLGFIVGPAMAALLVDIQPWLPGVAAAVTSTVAFTLVFFKLPETLPEEARHEARRHPLNLVEPARGRGESTRSWRCALRHSAGHLRLLQLRDGLRPVRHRPTRPRDLPDRLALRLRGRSRSCGPGRDWSAVWSRSSARRSWSWRVRSSRRWRSASVPYPSRMAGLLVVLAALRARDRVWLRRRLSSLTSKLVRARRGRRRHGHLPVVLVAGQDLRAV